MATSAKASKRSERPTSSAQQQTTKASMKKSHLSEEMIGDSDDDDAAEEDRSTKKKTGAASRNSKIESERSNALPNRRNGVKRKSETSSSSSESEDESESSESDSIEDGAGRQAKKVKVVQEQQPSEEEESSSEDEDEDEDGDEDEDMPDAEEMPNTKSTVKGAVSIDPSSFASISVQPFRPPAGFVALQSQSLNSSLLSESDLEGKQIWHICAPARLPLDSVEEIALNAIGTNTTALTHKSMEYVWNEVWSGNTCTVMLASRNGYKASSQRIAKRLNLQQKVDLPQLSTKQASQVTGSSAAAHIAQASVRSIRPQPKGLRMRYKPPGFGTGEAGAIGFDSESEDQTNRKSALQFPVTLGGASEEQIVDEESGKRADRKKKKAVMADGVPEQKSNGLRHEEGSSASVAMTPVMKVVAPEAGDSSLADDAKRKEAKRLKKEARKAKRAAS